MGVAVFVYYLPLRAFVQVWQSKNVLFQILNTKPNSSLTKTFLCTSDGIGCGQNGLNFDNFQIRIRTPSHPYPAIATDELAMAASRLRRCLSVADVARLLVVSEDGDNSDKDSGHLVVTQMTPKYAMFVGCIRY